MSSSSEDDNVVRSNKQAKCEHTSGVEKVVTKSQFDVHTRAQWCNKESIPPDESVQSKEQSKPNSTFIQSGYPNCPSKQWKSGVLDKGCMK